jgi:acetyl-CoA carboxylase carboxyl transferase subunit alpha
VFDRVAKALTNCLFELSELSPQQLLAQREQKYRKMGAVNGLQPT